MVLAMKAELVSQLLKGKKNHNGFQCKCPCHDDKMASLSIKDGEKDLVVYCHAGCDQQKLFLTIKELYEKHYGHEQKPQQFDRRKIKTTPYTYQDENGQDVFKAERYDYSDETKSFAQFHFDQNAWKPGRGEKEFCPYQYHAWKAKNVVAIFEGEKCADRARSLGIDSTCIPGGATAWRDSYKKYFAGKDVIVCPDNDPPGLEFAQSVFSSLCDVSNPFIVKLPGLKEKEDVVEWIENGGTKEQFIQLALKAKASPLEAMGFEDEFLNTNFVEEIQKENSRRIIPFGIPFLDDAWGGILPTDLCVLSAKSGSGKTQMAMTIAKNIISSGGKVAFYALEAFKYEIGMRMMYTIAVGNYIRRKNLYDPLASFSDFVRGEPNLVRAMKPFIDEARQFVEKKWAGKFLTHYLKQKFTIEDFEKRFPLIQKHCDLIVLDHLHYISKTQTQNSNEFLSDAMFRIKDLVLAYKKPVLMIVHVRKEDSQDRKPIPDAEDIHGSSDIFKIGTKVALIGKPLDGGYNADECSQTTYMKIPKDRLGEIQDWMIAKMKFEIKHQAYAEKYDIVKLSKSKDKSWTETELETRKLPSWYGRSTKKPELDNYEI